MMEAATPPIIQAKKTFKRTCNAKFINTHKLDLFNFKDVKACKPSLSAQTYCWEHWGWNIQNAYIEIKQSGPID
jgi:hypothetical protein